MTLVGVALFKSGNDGEVHLEKEGELTEKRKDEENSEGNHFRQIRQGVDE